MKNPWFGRLERRPSRTAKARSSTKSGAPAKPIPTVSPSRFRGLARQQPGGTDRRRSPPPCFNHGVVAHSGRGGVSPPSAWRRPPRVTLDKVSDGFRHHRRPPDTRGEDFPEPTTPRFQELAAKAKAGCPVSKLLKADITLDASVTH